ncbi:uncharacterized protein TRAVEDRAFT_47389 [Trametes versicolor FP-101664 SS1]|uniref:uncharacterized protein n=1 Tax=Trametes versicolor (strain FP-101664) TaxID=717944 RepID=UPI00046240EE|nr:uncharacterized protein TRAVEDRAFT_47389 [Trametes versicolor FP-101664 SS1]EIW58221.1 hypothetical protein TRAVEDRAFT_47389 [Trametes versicolor FP-101664 SS1]
MPIQIMHSFQGNQDVRDHTRIALEAQIYTHENAIIELKSRINGMAFTARLPPEILSEIFTLVAVDYYQAKRWHHFGSTHAYKWITLTHVCRAWREIALDTPRLWSHIVLTQPAVAKQVLARSKKAPLWLSASLNHSDDQRAETMDVLMKESGRLKELHLTGPAHTVQALSAKWRMSADLLETINISSDFRQFDPASLLPAPPLSSDIFSGQTPKLRHLQIHRIAVDWSNPLFCNTLKTLIIHTVYDNAPSLGEFSQLLDALEAMPQLERLQLNESIPRLPDDTTQLSHHVQRTISLQHLRHIELFSDAIDSANLLRHISAPAELRLTVSGRTERGVTDLVHIFSECLGRSTPFRTARLAPLYSSQVSMKLWRSYVDSIEGGNVVPPSDAELTLDAYPHSRALQALIQLSTFFTQIYRFEVQLEAHRSWDWEMIFGRMPQVRVLSVTGQGDLGFLPALATLRYDDDADAQAQIDGNEKPPLRHLHTLELSGVRFGCGHSDHQSHFLEALLDWLILRCNYGVPILRLVLRACINVEGDAIERLQEVVPDIEWDEREYLEEEGYLEGMFEPVAPWPGEQLFYAPEVPDVLGHLYHHNLNDDPYGLDFYMPVIPFGH